jgi:hypothetical protein
VPLQLISPKYKERTIWLSRLFVAKGEVPVDSPPAVHVVPVIRVGQTEALQWRELCLDKIEPTGIGGSWDQRHAIAPCIAPEIFMTVCRSDVIGGSTLGGASKTERCPGRSSVCEWSPRELLREHRRRLVTVPFRLFWCRSLGGAPDVAFEPKRPRAWAVVPWARTHQNRQHGSV